MDIIGNLQGGALNALSAINPDWSTVIIVYLVGQFLPIETIAKVVIKTLKKILPRVAQVPVLFVINKFAKAIDREIPDDVKKIK